VRPASSVHVGQHFFYYYFPICYCLPSPYTKFLTPCYTHLPMSPLYILPIHFKIPTGINPGTQWSLLFFFLFCNMLAIKFYFSFFFFYCFGFLSLIYFFLLFIYAYNVTMFGSFLPHFLHSLPFPHHPLTTRQKLFCPYF
jgi:hypothetical protein